MDINEVFKLYLASEDVEKPFEVAPDLEYVIWDEELDYVWRMIVLPIEAVGTDLSLDPTPGCTKEDEDERFERIREWMREKGIMASLEECPPIARMVDEVGLGLIDGRHRLALAHQHGLTEVRMLVGAAPGWSPALSKAPTI